MKASADKQSDRQTGRHRQAAGSQAERQSLVEHAISSIFTNNWFPMKIENYTSEVEYVIFIASKFHSLILRYQKLANTA